MSQDWSHGYFAESGYMHYFHAETTPSHLRWVATLRGVAAPADHFRYLDLGCGQGLSLLVLAANQPGSEFVGIDFMPEHIAHARQLAASAGLTNVRFIEGDFITLAKQPEALGEFDYVVAHGISTWVSPQVRESLFSLAGAVLKPGGLMYNSYNTYPGWLAMSPFQHLVSLFRRRGSGQQALQLAYAHLNGLQDKGCALMQQLPDLGKRLKGMSGQDAPYLLQEYNNSHWQPVYSDQMLTIAQQHKLTFAATATLTELFESLYPPELLAQINAENDLVVRETLRDLALGQSFRRDVYIKGMQLMWSQDQKAALLAQRFIATRLVALPAADANFDIRSDTLSLAGKRQDYLAVLDAFEAGASVEDVLNAHPQYSLASLVQVATLLMHGGWLAFDGAPAQAEGAIRLNQALANAVLAGAPYRYLALGRTLGGAGVSDIDLMLVGLFTPGTTPETLAKQLLAALQTLGKPVEQDAEQQALVIAQRFITEVLPKIQRLGAMKF